MIFFPLVPDSGPLSGIADFLVHFVLLFEHQASSFPGCHRAVILQVLMESRTGTFAYAQTADHHFQRQRVKFLLILSPC